MSSIKADDVKKLRETTGAGMQDAHKALSDADGDMEKAIDALRKRGAIKQAKKSGRSAREGLVDCYVHGGRVGVLVEVNCETDFVAKTDDFKNLVHEIALQIAATAPIYVHREEVPAEIVEKEREVLREVAKSEGKPQAVAEKIVAGKLDKFFAEICLLEQPTIKDPKQTIAQMLTDTVARVGENIVITRFTRYQLGEEK